MGSRHADPDRIVFESSLVKIGAFRLPADHPHFEDTGPAHNYCFVFPRQACWIEHEGERPFVADSTVVPLYNPGRPYRRGRIDPAGDASDWFGVAPAALREMVARFDARAADGSDRLFTRGAINGPPGLFLAQRRIFNEVDGGDRADPLYVEEGVLTLLGAVLQKAYEGAEPAARSASRATLAARTRAHLARTFLGRESLADVAAAVGVSPFHVCRVFHHETGYSLHRYRTELRLRWSLQPLADGVDILTTALDAGFSHHSHFTMAFRRTFGMPPSAFRRQRRLAGVMPLEMMNTRPE
ncbi:MAG TPA: helix-turn-helix transcriptional regulator [Vicinamibacterales bacterium]|nr:helix-turn-helix transcriptional regulator [Vicinamibacterales bacterium]